MYYAEKPKKIRIIDAGQRELPDWFYVDYSNSHGEKSNKIL